jgi:hypothetical protein
VIPPIERVVFDFHRRPWKFNGLVVIWRDAAYSVFVDNIESLLMLVDAEAVFLEML